MSKRSMARDLTDAQSISLSLASIYQCLISELLHETILHAGCICVYTLVARLADHPFSGAQLYLLVVKPRLFGESELEDRENEPRYET